MTAWGYLDELNKIDADALTSPTNENYYCLLMFLLESFPSYNGVQRKSAMKSPSRVGASAMIWLDEEASFSHLLMGRISS
jgi:hypothetical protein